MKVEYLIAAADFVLTGGMDRANFALADYLARSGRLVHLVAHRVADELRAHPNVTFHRVPKPADAYALGGPLLGSAALARAVGVARRGGIVVANGGNCPFPGVNWVHYVHAAYVPQLGGLRSLKSRALHQLHTRSERIALRAAKAVVANSERTRMEIIHRLGVREERVRTIYLGIDASRFRPPRPEERSRARQMLGWLDERPRVVFVGALGDRRKGFDVVHAAWRKLCATSSWDAELVVVGRGAELPVWRERAVQEGFGGRVSFLGFRQDVDRILAAADALVAPTRYEAYGLGVHEAICCGLPALVSATAGIAERYPADLRTLLLEEPESAKGLAESLLQWRHEMSDRKDRVAPFADELRSRSWDDMAKDIASWAELGDSLDG